MGRASAGTMAHSLVCLLDRISVVVLQSAVVSLPFVVSHRLYRGARPMDMVGNTIVVFLALAFWQSSPCLIIPSSYEFLLRLLVVRTAAIQPVVPLGSASLVPVLHAAISL